MEAKKTRRFRGKVYYIYTSRYYKIQAMEAAKRLRSEGKRARVAPYGWHYGVWVNG